MVGLIDFTRTYITVHKPTDLSKVCTLVWLGNNKVRYAIRVLFNCGILNLSISVRIRAYIIP